MAIVKSQTTDLQLVIETPQITTTSLVTDQTDTIVARIKGSFTSILTNFHAGYFRVSLSLGGQALLWKTLIGPTDDTNSLRLKFNMLHPKAFILLWLFAFFILFLFSILYLLKSLIHFKLVKEEFLHHVGVNFLFVPSISGFLLLQSAPFFTPNNPFYLFLWFFFAVPVVVLDVKIYGQWFTKGKKFLSAVANPTSHLSVIGNLVGAQAAANMGWKESAIFFFSVGMVHYLVLFVTLYQRLSGSDRLPKMLRPAFFLFFGAPSMASLAWQSISGGYDTASKMLFFLSLFLFMSLVCRPALFKRCMKRFNVAWWGFSFPLSALALASTEYAEEVKGGGFPHFLMLFLLAFSVLVSISLVIITLLNTLLPCINPISSLLSYLPRLSHQSNSTITQQVFV